MVQLLVKLPSQITEFVSMISAANKAQILDLKKKKKVLYRLDEEKSILNFFSQIVPIFEDIFRQGSKGKKKKAEFAH